MAPYRSGGGFSTRVTAAAIPAALVLVALVTLAVQSPSMPLSSVVAYSSKVAAHQRHMPSCAVTLCSCGPACCGSLCTCGWEYHPAGHAQESRRLPDVQVASRVTHGNSTLQNQPHQQQSEPEAPWRAA